MVGGGSDGGRPPRPSARHDPRRLGIAFRGLRLTPFQSPFPGVGYDDEIWFGSGWSDAEDGYRWSADRVATLVYPLGRTPRNLRWELILEAGAIDTQNIEILVNGDSVATTAVDAGSPAQLAFSVPVETLRAQSLNAIELRIPDARRVGDDPRLLGLRFESLQMRSASSAESQQ